MDGLGHLVAGFTAHVFDDEGQLPLVEQFQGIIGPADRADAVVTVEIEGVGHPAILAAAL